MRAHKLLSSLKSSCSKCQAPVPEGESGGRAGPHAGGARACCGFRAGPPALGGDDRDVTSRRTRHLAAATLQQPPPQGGWAESPQGLRRVGVPARGRKAPRLTPRCFSDARLAGARVGACCGVRQPALPQRTPRQAGRRRAPGASPPVCTARVCCGVWWRVHSQRSQHPRAAVTFSERGPASTSAAADGSHQAWGPGRCA